MTAAGGFQKKRKSKRPRLADKAPAACSRRGLASPCRCGSIRNVPAAPSTTTRTARITSPVVIALVLSSTRVLLATRYARIFVSGRNLKTWTDYTGYNPDVNSNGASSNISLGTDFYAYPLARTITFGVSGSW